MLQNHRQTKHNPVQWLTPNAQESNCTYWRKRQVSVGSSNDLFNIFPCTFTNNAFSFNTSEKKKIQQGNIYSTSYLPGALQLHTSTESNPFLIIIYAEKGGRKTTKALTTVWNPSLTVNYHNRGRSEAFWNLLSR